MKGTFFQKPLEYNLEIRGENWTQGENISVNMSIANHSKEAISIIGIGCHLCYGQNKKMKLKDSSAFKLTQSQLFKQSTINSHEIISIDCNFQLAQDIFITDSMGSMQLVCGDFNHPYDTGILELNIKSHKIINSFIDIFETFFKFKFKSLKNKQGFIEAKIGVPDNKEWTSIQAMNVRMKIEHDSFVIICDFKLKKMDFAAGSTSTKDSKLEIKEILTKSEYAGYGDAINQDKIKFVIENILKQVRIKPII